MDGFTGRFEHCEFSSLARLSERIGECCTAPWRVRTKEVEELAPRLELGTLPGKASADLDGGATSV